MGSDLELFQSGRAGSIPVTENKRGSDCSGADEAANRILTLANTQKSARELVNINGVVQTITADYTVSHAASSSTITFLSKVFNADYISVRYFI